jgi:hypothetical protein
VRARGDEVYVGLDCITGGGKDAVAPEGLFAGEACGFDESQPFLDATRFGAIAVVVDDSFAPGYAEGGVFAAG